MESPRWKHVIDDSLYNESGSIGACREYFPYMLYPTDTYKSEYSNSLMTRIKVYISHMKNNPSVNTFPAEVLEGRGSAEIIEKNAPTLKVKINITSNTSLVQLPLIYYPGYAVDLSNGESIEAIEVDGLVAFELPKGEYVLTTKYEGTKIMKIGALAQEISIYGLLFFASLALLYDYKKRNLIENALY